MSAAPLVISHMTPHTEMPTILDTLASRLLALGTEANSIALEIARMAAPVTPTADELAGGFRVLPDGTKQFGYAPVGTNADGSVVNRVANTMPAVPAEWGVGARFLVAGTFGEPLVVTRVGDGVVFAIYTDSEGAREMPFVPNQCTLVEAAS